MKKKHGGARGRHWTLPANVLSICQFCGESYRATRIDSTTCSGRCRVALHRRKKEVRDEN